MPSRHVVIDEAHTAQTRGAPLTVRSWRLERKTNSFSVGLFESVVRQVYIRNHFMSGNLQPCGHMQARNQSFQGWPRAFQKEPIKVDVLTVNA
uniref:Uncharacterized protein n=1 Tax=Oryza sativa subsp. japonica TaxID=39947 RepID=Q651N1_ORYSJ|nr:hypothetical protein [Oryza sativa Japonica Group]